jgi:hypothetical protein
MEFRSGILFFIAPEFPSIPAHKIASRQVLHIAALRYSPMRCLTVALNTKIAALGLNDKAIVLQLPKPAAYFLKART